LVDMHRCIWEKAQDKGIAAMMDCPTLARPLSSHMVLVTILE